MAVPAPAAWRERLRRPPVEEPPRSEPVFCEGWRGWTMKQRQAPFWVYGSGSLTLVVTAPEPTRAYLWQGEEYQPHTVRGETTIEVELEGEQLAPPHVPGTRALRDDAAAGARAGQNPLRAVAATTGAGSLNRPRTEVQTR